MKTYEFYTLEDKRFYDKPYGVLRTEAARARVERYDPASESWVLAQSEAQMIWDPDPGESANKITEQQAQALIAQGGLVDTWRR